MENLAVFNQEQVYKYAATLVDQDGKYVGDFDGYYSNTKWFPENQVKNCLEEVIVNGFKKRYPQHFDKSLTAKNVQLEKINDIERAKNAVGSLKLDYVKI
jgi:hypothetical protein